MKSVVAIEEVPWEVLSPSGSAVSLPEYNYDEAGIKLGKTGFVGSVFTPSGVSPGAKVIEQIFQQIFFEISHWSRIESNIDIERDMAVLLPPKTERIVTIRASHVGQPDPLISLDNILDTPRD